MLPKSGNPTVKLVSLGMDSKQRQRLATAYRQAGRVGVALVEKLGVAPVTIEQEQDYLGLTTQTESFRVRIDSVANPSPYNPALRANAERYMVSIIAGYRAERRHTGKDNAAEAETDLDTVGKLVAALSRDAREATHYQNWLYARADKRVEEQWDVIEHVAAALYEETTLDEDRLTAILSLYQVAVDNEAGGRNSVRPVFRSEESNFERFSREQGQNEVDR